MDKNEKIKNKADHYCIISWLLISLTVLLAVGNLIQKVSETRVFDTLDVLGLFTEILLQPFLWIALILRWRMYKNRKVIGRNE